MSKEIIQLNDDNFTSKTSKGVWAVDFWAEWCQPCKVMAIELEKAALELNDKALFGKVNVDENMDLPNRFEVMSIPTLIIIKDGKEIARSVGAMNKAGIIQEIKSVLQQ